MVASEETFFHKGIKLRRLFLLPARRQRLTGIILSVFLL